MRIFFTGAQGTGKTTLVKELSSYLPDYEIIDSLAETLIKGNINWRKDNVMDFQTAVVGAYLAKWFSSKDFISSRCISDTYAYLKADIKNTSDEKLKKFYSNFLEWSLNLKDAFDQRNTLIIYVPPMFELTAKRLRSTDKEFQQEVDSSIKEYLSRTNMNYLTITKLPIPDRIEEVLEELRKRNVSV